MSHCAEHQNTRTPGQLCHGYDQIEAASAHRWRGRSQSGPACECALGSWTQSRLHTWPRSQHGSLPNRAMHGPGMEEIRGARRRDARVAGEAVGAGGGL